MLDATTSLGKILFLQAHSGDRDEVVKILEQLGAVNVETDVQAAMSALSRQVYDLVVASPAAFGALDVQAGTLQLSTILEAIGHAVSIYESNGSLIWANTKAAQLPQQVQERIERHCAEHFQRTDKPAPLPRPRSLSVVTEGEQYFDGTVTPIVDQIQGRMRLVVVIQNVTRARRLQQKMDAIDNAGRELVRVDSEQLSRMDVRQRLELLERKIIRYTRELLAFDNFVIRLLDKNSNKLELVLCAGLPSESQQIDIYASTENNGISGYVAATGRSYVCADVRRDPRYLPGIDNAQSSLTVPLRLHDQVIGILNIESERAAAFSEDERQFAEIFARYVAIALHILDLLVVERRTATGRLADNVTTEIAAPLSDILADATTLMEDYIGHDDLRHRLQAISDNVARIRQAIKQVTQPIGGILGSKPTAPIADALLEGKAVLVADDEDIIRMTVQDVLTKLGCAVETARDGTEALAMIKQRRYDLVISDIRMPGHNGYEVFEAVKAGCSDCPVIFMTGFGYDPNHCIIRANTEGLAAVLFKPFKVDQLLTEVRAAVAGEGRK